MREHRNIRRRHSFANHIALTTHVSSSPTGTDIGGLWLDPNHYTDDGTMKGTRFISDYYGSSSSSTITVIGTDDGSSYWTLYGQYTSDDGSKLVNASLPIALDRCSSVAHASPATFIPPNPVFFAHRPRLTNLTPVPTSLLRLHVCHRSRRLILVSPNTHHTRHIGKLSDPHPFSVIPTASEPKGGPKDLSGRYSAASKIAAATIIWDDGANTTWTQDTSGGLC